MDDHDLSAILSATSISSIPGQSTRGSSQRNSASSKSRGKEKGKEKVSDEKSQHSARKTDRKGKGKASDQIFHTVARTDTLEGIALKYGVQVSDLKYVNRLFSPQDLFARKELLIPAEVKEEEGSLVLRPRRSYDRNITAPPGEENRRSFENGAPKYFYPATPEEEVVEQRQSLLGFGYNFSSQSGMLDSGRVKLHVTEEQVRRRLEEDENRLYDL